MVGPSDHRGIRHPSLMSPICAGHTICWYRYIYSRSSQYARGPGGDLFTLLNVVSDGLS